VENMKTKRYFHKLKYWFTKMGERWYDKRPWMKKYRKRISIWKKKKEIYTGYFNNVNEGK